MQLTKRHYDEISCAIEMLFARVRSLRKAGVHAPSEEEMDLLFTDLEDYDVLDADPEVNQCLFLLHGAAIVLGFASGHDLYLRYRNDLGDGALRILDVTELVAAADAAAECLAHCDHAADREIRDRLFRALAPWTGKVSP